MIAAPLEVVNSGIRLAADTRGEGPNLVCTTGWANDRSVWEALATNLAADHRVTTWDLRGHGASDIPPPDCYARSDALDDLAAVLDAADRPAILIGHSLGGYLSLAYTLGRPDDVAGLVLVATGPGFRKEESRREWNTSVQAAVTNLDLPEGAEGLSLHVDSLVIDRLAEITAPTLVVLGERDRRFAASVAVFERHLDVRATVVVPEAGHMVHTKASDEVASAVRAFVADLGRTTADD